ncbi:MAG: cytochrome c [Dehalococcoidia bacterium]|nr:cytochrome c [Dehalococcoidia bacterium]
MNLSFNSFRGNDSVGRKIAKRSLLVAVGLLAFIVAGCNSGAYPFDLLQEMHYQQYSRFQEPARFYPPAGSVPFKGSSVGYSQADPNVGHSQAELQTLRNPVPNTADNIEKGKQLFKVNCAPCHGPEAKGDGPLKGYFEAAGSRPPPDLTQATTAPSLFSPDGVVFGVITNGQGKALEPYTTLTNMPNFVNLLSEQERWTLVAYLRAVSGTTGPIR